MMAAGLDPARAEEIRQLRRMRIASLVEGATLVALVFVAAPLKHLAGIPTASAVVGPVHGMAFLIYLWLLIQTVAGQEWSKRDMLVVTLAAFVPFGAFVTERLLRTKAAALSRPARAPRVSLA